jgi:hypothetical protein
MSKQIIFNISFFEFDLKVYGVMNARPEINGNVNERRQWTAE